MVEIVEHFHAWPGVSVKEGFHKSIMAMNNTRNEDY